MSQQMFGFSGKHSNRSLRWMEQNTCYMIPQRAIFVKKSLLLLWNCGCLLQLAAAGWLALPAVGLAFFWQGQLQSTGADIVAAKKQAQAVQESVQHKLDEAGWRVVNFRKLSFQQFSVNPRYPQKMLRHPFQLHVP